MSANFTPSYVLELERLILDVLLPTYERYYAEKNLKPPAADIHPDLLRDIKRKKVVPALLRRMENYS